MERSRLTREHIQTRDLIGYTTPLFVGGYPSYSFHTASQRVFTQGGVRIGNQYIQGIWHRSSIFHKSSFFPVAHSLLLLSFEAARQYPSVKSLDFRRSQLQPEFHVFRAFKRKKNAFAPSDYYGLRGLRQRSPRSPLFTNPPRERCFCSPCRRPCH